MTKRKVWSWALYDWANSAFATTVMAGFFPVFFKQYWSQGIDPTLSTARLASVLSTSGLAIAVVSPFLGALADNRGYKKLFLFIFMTLGLLSTAYLAFVDMGNWSAAATAYGIALFGFTASCVFNDAMLPAVAKEEEMDRVSSLGYGLGYLGGGVLFLFNVVMYLKPELFGIEDGVHAVKYSFISVAVWWLVFSIPMFRFVPEPKVEDKEPLSKAFKVALKSLIKTLRDLRKHKNLLFFLLAYWLYIDGVYTVMAMAVDYGAAIGLESSDMITALLITQFIGFPFAILFGRLADRWGCRGPVMIAIAVYMVTVVAATFMRNSSEFYLLATVIGMVQGGVQALSRSLFGKMVPQGSAGEYFGLFNLIGKFASVMGPIAVGLTAYLTSNPRYSMYGLLPLFIVGAFLLGLVREPRGKTL